MKRPESASSSSFILHPSSFHMTSLALILAATDDINPYVGRVIFGIVVLILWGAGAMASAVRKQKQQERARQQKMWAEVQREMNGRREGTMAPRQGSGAPQAQ